MSKPANTTASSSVVQVEVLRKKVTGAKAKSTLINRATWGVASGVMIYGTVNVTLLLIQHHVPVLIAPLLSLMVDLGLVVALVAAPVLADYRRKSGWVNVLRWVTALMSWGLNVAEPAIGKDWIGVGIHSCGPVLLIVVAEAGAALQRTLAGIVADLDAELAVAEQAEPKARQAQADLRAEIAELATQLAQTRVQVETETGRADEEMAVRVLAETRAAQAETRIEQAETLAAAEAETRAEIQTATRAEIGRFEAAAQAADRRADEQARLAQIAQGHLAEAREAADRAVVARVHAEQAAAVQVERLGTAAEQIQAQLRTRIGQATTAADGANEQVTALGEQVRTLQGQLTEARGYGERQATGRVQAEQRFADLQAEHAAALDELERVQLAAAAESERLQRQLTRALGRAEIESGRHAEISRGPGRKSLLPVPVGMAGNLPVVETVAPETVATVLVAWAQTPQATQSELFEKTGISARTIRKVLRAIPAEIAGEVAGQVLALTGRAA